MKKTLLITVVSALSVSLATPVYAAQSASMEQRVKRLERMLENPVLLQLSRRLGEQQRDIQALQDENDRLKRKLRQFEEKMDKRYIETDERLSKVEGVKPTAQIAAPVTSMEKAEPVVDSIKEQPVENVAEAVTTEAATEAQAAEIQKAAEVEQTPAVNEKTANATAEKTAEKVAAAEPKAETEKAATTADMSPITTHVATDIEKTKYKSAFTLMRASKYDESIASFQEFLKSHPKSELASNAAYWSGEGYLIKGDNQSALDSFMTVIKRYPDSPKVPDAKLRAADSLDNLGKTKEAVALYQDLVKTRPQSRAAKNAKKRLERKQ